ncbi:hypothetical protein QBC34DRAFT_128011 [Podospora aff. communis PSN243]|uniref:CCHC-type domain-containing protein n=1 Tax=Podospora aff. communis PSN243 TaxID=3040156 RepID=A0AAV9GK38_9PEZI|nr:hypothetical protein QBC34DRAFT_128011 [Podospora aff. communis PSN243]
MPEMANMAWLLQNLEPEFGPFVAQVTQALRSNPKAYNWESLTANLLDEAKRLQVAEKAIRPIQMVGKYKVKKSWKNHQKKAIFCKYCKLRGHKDEDCAFLHPEKAPKGWKHPVENQKANIKPKNNPHPREQREHNINLLMASATNTTSESRVEEITSPESQPAFDDVLDSTPNADIMEF